MWIRRFLPVLAAMVGLAVHPAGVAGPDDGKSVVAAQLVGHWKATMVLPNGIKLQDDQRIRADGFASGRVVVSYRDGSEKSSTAYSFAWRVDRNVLVADGIVRAPPDPGEPESTRDEIIHLDDTAMVLQDLSNRIVVHYERVP